jgi:hydroxymethylglutaryl-CoA synthase
MKKQVTNGQIGLSDIGLYVPGPKMVLESLAEERIIDNPKLARHLDRALNFTGQESIRFPETWEDTSTMAAEAAKGVLKKRTPSQVKGLRYIATGTETGVDHSKPVSAYVEGMLQNSGLNVPNTLSSFQVQHACAGGTMALLGVGAMLNMSSGNDESGLVLCSDIARYNTGTTAEITQGAGAAALLVEKNPRLLELDLSTIGYCSKNVDDFFRPIGSKIAQVKGRYSMDCYIDNLKEAVNDHCRQRGISPTGLLATTDFFVLHAPFKSMPEKAMQALLKEHLGLVNGQTEAFLSSHGLYGGTDPIGKIGNTYSASMYIALAYLLKEQFERLGNKIVGKRIMLASYGSGNTMIIISARIAKGAPAVIKGWNLLAHLEDGIDSSIEDYEAWVNGPYSDEEYNEKVENAEIPQKSFYLSEIREDGYREYSYRESGVDRNQESKTSNNLYKPAAVLN